MTVTSLRAPRLPCLLPHSISHAEALNTMHSLYHALRRRWSGIGPRPVLSRQLVADARSLCCTQED